MSFSNNLKNHNKQNESEKITKNDITNIRIWPCRIKKRSGGN